MGYPVAAGLTAVAVLLLELFVLRTGLLRRRTYWIGLAICAFFQVIADGWLTKLSAPIVRYDPGHFLGVRFPWDIPIEDFVFGWAMLTLTLVLWERQHDPALDAVPAPDPVVRR